uniref:SFRICE_011372 n=1 Tax=Spodoptera frugiperda TaxID=7108 RepID=A0A2H1V046_SPOFR
MYADTFIKKSEIPSAADEFLIIRDKKKDPDGNQSPPQRRYKCVADLLGVMVLRVVDYWLPILMAVRMRKLDFYYVVIISGAADYLAGLPGLQLEKQGYERGGFKPLTNYNQPEDILGFQVLQIVRPGFRIIKLRDA